MPSRDADHAADPLRQSLERSLSGAYQVERELGGGGMARVFLATDSALGRKVVVKLLSPALAHELSGERFAREVKLSARLQHPNIVPVLAAGTAEDLPYYTMPYIEGDSLRTRLDRLPAGQRMPLAQALDVLRDVARALAYAHGAGIVHRDIKPENVLLADDAAVVADFGIAKALVVSRTHEQTTANPTLTQSGAVLGTPAYMAPEQAAGDPGLDHRSDLYSWGILAYEVIAGEHPFADRRSLQSLVTAHLTATPRPVQDLVPELPARVGELVMRCLAKEPAGRPESAREVVALLGGAEARASRARRWGALAQTSSIRSRAFAIGGVLAVLAAGGAGAVYMSRGSGPEPSAARSATAPAAPSPAADAYLRGRIRASNENPGDNAAAIAALLEAIALDPLFAPAYAELSRAYTIRAFYFAPDSEKKTLGVDAEVALEKALALDPNLAEAHFARGLMLWSPARRFPHDQTVRAYRRALALDPTLDEARHQLALVYLHVGLLDEARVQVDSALMFNPANTLARFRLGVIALYSGDYERAYDVFNSTPLERSPSLWGFQTATALFRLGREAEATALIDRHLRDHPLDEGGVGTSVRAMMLAKHGRRREAEAAIAAALRLGRNFGHFHHTAYNIASAYAMLGDNDRALRYLTEAVEGGFPCYPLFAQDTQLDGLREDPRFVALMDRLEKDWRERKRTL